MQTFPKRILPSSRMPQQGLTLALSVTLVFACGTEAGHRDDSDGEIKALPEPSHTEDDVVAKVNGKPVLASCVLAQMEELDIESKEAVEQCINFELLAQTAESTPVEESMNEALQVQKRESVRALLAADYYANRKGPGALPQAYIDRLWDRAIIVGGKTLLLTVPFRPTRASRVFNLCFSFSTGGKNDVKGRKGGSNNCGGTCR